MTSATVLARTLIDELARQNVREVVIAPGSRSAPLALAAAARPSLRVHVRVDERSAAFLALGLARGAADGMPVAVVCSSGTATANFHPAVLEADAAAVPLLLLTADRPAELREVGANQTTHQRDLYGPALRWSGEVHDVADDGRYVRSVASRAVAEAAGRLGRAPGPVHLNVPLREPLLPAADEVFTLPDPRPDAAYTTTPAPGAWPAAGLGRPAAEAVLAPRRRGLLVAGDGAAGDDATLELADRLGWPVLAEPTSGLRRRAPALRAGHWLAAHEPFVATHTPEVVVLLGRPVLSRPIEALIARAGTVVVCDPHGRWWDPGRHAALLVPAALQAWAAPLRDRPPTEDRSWLEAWLTADRAAAAAVDEVLDADPDALELRIARDLAAALPDSGLLVAASSLPIRHLNEVMAVRSGPRVTGNRGVSGIDGFVSTAVGAALGHRGPTAALAGDLSVVHDLTGLLLGPAEPRPGLPIVVLDNGGGGIFGLLPYGGLDRAVFERLFATPQPVDLGALAAAVGIRHEPVDDPAALPAQLAAAWAGDGPTLLHVRADRAGTVRAHARLRDAVAARLGDGADGSEGEAG